MFDDEDEEADELFYEDEDEEENEFDDEEEDYADPHEDL